MKRVEGIILAAGRSTRMKSTTPKVMIDFFGQTILERIVALSKTVCNHSQIIYGPHNQEIRQKHAHLPVSWVLQQSPLGTGDAVAQALPTLKSSTTHVLILMGDSPLVRSTTLTALVNEAPIGGGTILTSVLDNPTGYGRIVHDKTNRVKAVIEEKEANAQTKKIKEINAGAMVIDAKVLTKFLRIETNKISANREIYLTDIAAALYKANIPLTSHTTRDPYEAFGINTLEDLAVAERAFCALKRKDALENGLRMDDSKRFDCHGELTFGENCRVGVGVLIKGKVSLGSSVTIEGNCRIENTSIGSNANILTGSIIRSSTIAEGATIGPYANLRPTSVIGKGARIGSFVEVKKSNIGEGSNISHLCYIGDAHIGKNVNIGASVITCNYDGLSKHPTIIGDNAFIGSGTQLVAPVKVGSNATVGAGSVITKEAPENALTIARTRQKSVLHWQRKKRV